MTKKTLTPEQHAKFSKVGRSNVATAKAHERRIARMMTAWSGVPFRRRRVEGRENAVRVVELVADVIPCAGDFNFAIECKKGKDFSLDGLMSSPATSLFTGWWHQACYDAQLVSKDFEREIYPLLFFKPHPNWDWVAFSARCMSVLVPKPGTNANHLSQPWFPHLKFDHFNVMGSVEGDISHTKKPKLVSITLDPVIFCRWRDFEANVWPNATFHRYPDAAEIAKVTNSDEE